MSMGCVPDSLRRSSKIVLAGEGGIVVESTRLIVGLARMDEAEFVRDRRLDPMASRASGPSDTRFDLQRLEMVETRELMRDRPLPERLSARLFLVEWGVSIPVSFKS
jgi:hypothetical protein